MTDINDYLQSLKTKLEISVVEFQDKYNSLPQLEVQLLADINQILDASGGGGGNTGITEEQVTSAIENADLSAIASQTTLAAINTKTPALGANIAANSQPVTLANDGVFATSFGSSADSAASTDTSNSSFVSLFKRLLQRITTLLGFINNDASTYDRPISRLLSDTYFALIGIDGTSGSAATSDTGSFTILQFFKRILQRLTTLIQVAASNTLPTSADTAIIVANRDPVFAPRKVSITGFTSTSSTNTNLLDSSGAGGATDVRDSQSGILTIVSTVAGGVYTVQGAFNSGFTIGVKTLQIQEIDISNANPIIAPIISTIATRSFLLNLQGHNFIRVNLTSTAAAGITAYAVLNQAPSSSFQLNVQQAIASNLNANINSISSAVAVSTVTTLTQIGSAIAIVDISNNTITSTATTATLLITAGLSYSSYISVGAVSGTNPTLQIDIQESVDSGGNWFTVYSFPPIVATGAYACPKLPYTGNRIRYAQTVGGTSPSFTRSIVRNSYNDIPSVPTIIKKLGGIETTADLQVWGRVLKVNVYNGTASTIYLQVFNKSSALATGDMSVDIYAIFGTATGYSITLGADIFGEYGTYLGSNARIGLSSTFATYTPITPLAGTALFVDYH